MSRFAQLSMLNRLAPWVLFALVLWICWRLAQIFWLVLAPPQAPVARMVTLGGVEQPVPNITSFSLFDEQRPNFAASAPTSATVNIPMKLDGVFLSRPASQSAALIRVNNISKHYRVGQRLDETDLSLVDVHWNEIVLSRPDQSLMRLKFGQQNAEAVNPTATPVLNAPATSPTQQIDQMINEAQMQLRNNPAGYLSRMGVLATGQGYEVTNQVPAQMRSQLGLRAGDRIVSLNGQTLGQPEQDAQLLEQIRQTRRAQIEVKRGDQTMTIQQSF